MNQDKQPSRARLSLITGGSGYFGCLLRDRLVERGETVRVFDLVDVEDRPASVEFIQGDIRDTGAIARACEDVDVVYHNVAQVPLAKDREAFWSVNFGGTENLLNAARTAGVAKIVNTSSSAIFGVPKKNPVDESTEPTPMEQYGKAKLAAENLVRRHVAEHGIDATIIRPRTIVGHGRLGIFQILFNWIEEGRNIPVLGKGDNLYQFVHADDLADACIRAGGRPGFAVYNIGAERFGTMREILEALCRHAGTGSKVYSVPMGLAVAAMQVTSMLGLSPLGPYHSMMYGRSLWFDTSRAQRELDWKSRWSNEEMICESYDWYIRHKAEVLADSTASPHKSAIKQGVLAILRRFS
ncbi:MAG TPA: NAD-dependent epimerase/dehydratase family protein [Candidatus Limnocylindrales bacterium]|nr:NAD-dependent epimerase/dehydratase family protein [Candidatus Limnocylindrales bacterium]